MTIMEEFPRRTVAFGFTCITIGLGSLFLNNPIKLDERLAVAAFGYYGAISTVFMRETLLRDFKLRKIVLLAAGGALAVSSWYNIPHVTSDYSTQIMAGGLSIVGSFAVGFADHLHRFSRLWNRAHFEDPDGLNRCGCKPLFCIEAPL